MWQGEVETLVNDPGIGGSHNITFDGGAARVGMYFYTLNAAAVAETRNDAREVRKG